MSSSYPANSVTPLKNNRQNLSISVVLSFYNEEEVLRELINRLRKVLEPLKMDYELIFVNDGSTDSSLDILLEKARDDKHIKIINMSRNFGGFPCVFAGMKYAKGSAVIIMDTDLQDPPEVIPQLIDKWLEGADVVYTIRTTREDESAIKLWVTRLGYKLLRWTADDTDIPIEAGDFKLMSRRVVNELVKLNEKNPFPKGLIPWVGFKQVSVFYKREKRFAGKAHYVFFRGRAFKNFLNGLISISTLPLKLAFFFSSIIFLGGFCYLIAVIVMKYVGIIIPTWSIIVIIILFLGSMQLFTIGVLGLYLSNVYSGVRNRPNYIISSTIGLEDLK